MTTISSVRPSPIAGTWYPGNPELLHDEVDSFIDNAKPQKPEGKIIGLLAPHAGYRYSGSTAGYSYHCVKGLSFDTVVVLSPLHDYMPYPFLTTAHEYYCTPLGKVEVDNKLIENVSRAVFATAGIKVVSVANDHEHSLEIQLPFLQAALAAPFKLLPLMIREREPVILQKFSEALAETIKGTNVLLVASTDLSHYYPEREANNLDQYMLDQVASFSPESVLQAEEMGKGYACGVSSVAVLLWTAKLLGGKTISILHHNTSAHATGDSSQVVGYGAAVITA